MTTTNSRQINQLRRVCITKKSLDESLANYARIMTTANKKNCCQVKEPQFSADNNILNRSILTRGTDLMLLTCEILLK